MNTDPTAVPQLQDGDGVAIKIRWYMGPPTITRLTTGSTTLTYVTPLLLSQKASLQQG